MIDPEFWSDEEIGKWSFDTRLFYIGLWNFADDEGRFKAADLLLKSQIFPYDSSIDIKRIKKELNHKIEWYENEGLQYGYIRNFLKYQRIDRPTESKLPIPPSIVEPSTNTRRTLAPNIREVNISKDKLSKGANAHLSQEEFLRLLSENTAYKHINLTAEFGKMSAWISVNPGRKLTKRFAVNWLNRIEKPLNVSGKYDDVK
jgi:hypothetical protein